MELSRPVTGKPCTPGSCESRRPQSPTGTCRAAWVSRGLNPPFVVHRLRSCATWSYLCFVNVILRRLQKTHHIESSRSQCKVNVQDIIKSTWWAHVGIRQTRSQTGSAQSSPDNVVLGQWRLTLSLLPYQWARLSWRISGTCAIVCLHLASTSSIQRHRVRVITCAWFAVFARPTQAIGCQEKMGEIQVMG